MTDRFRTTGDPLFAKEYRMLAFVPRWGIAPRLTHQSVAEHSYYVALYADQLCDFLDVPWQEKTYIVGWALRHDGLETWTGDPPGPAKRYFVDEAKMQAYSDAFAEQVPDYGEYRRLATARAVFVLKLADLIDEVMYLRFELSMGNSMVRDLYRLSLDGLRDRLDTLEEQQGEAIWTHVTHQLSRIESEGALIPPLRPENGGKR